MKSVGCVVDLEFVLSLVMLHDSAEPAEAAPDALVLLAERVLGYEGPFCVREGTTGKRNSECSKPP